MYKSLALLIEGRLPETVHRRSEVWLSRDAARNRRLLGRRGAPPAGHYDPAARSSLHGLRRIMPQTEARPTGQKSPRRSAERRASRVWDARRCAQRLACRARCVHAPLTRQARRVPLHPCACRRSAHPSRWGFNFTTRAQRAAGTKDAVHSDEGCLAASDSSGQRVWLFEIVRWSHERVIAGDGMRQDRGAGEHRSVSQHCRCRRDAV